MMIYQADVDPNVSKLIIKFAEYVLAANTRFQA